MHRSRRQSLQRPGFPPHHLGHQFTPNPTRREDSILKAQLLLALALAFPCLARQPLLVISVDGLDQRYLADRDRLGLKIPHIRQLLKEGQWSAGVIGAVPTITWPSHTTIITGVPPSEHGILTNRRPASEGGDYPWTADLIRTPTLLQAAHAAGLKTATITWPVTVNAPVDFNLPEYFQRRRGGAMDLRSIESKSVPPNLVHSITEMFPSFAQEWMDDRTRTQAVVYLLKTQRPDLILVHLVDLDSEQHDDGPFSRESKAILELTDEYIGEMMAAAPKNYAIALVSDHGFEKIDKDVNLQVLAAEKQITSIRPMGGVVLANDEAGATFLRETAKDKQYGIEREIPREELLRYAPRYKDAVAAFEPAEGYWFGTATKGELFEKPREAGNHGHWPTRYRVVYVMRASGAASANLPEISQIEIAGRLAAVLGIPFKAGR